MKERRDAIKILDKSEDSSQIQREFIIVRSNLRRHKWHKYLKSHYKENMPFKNKLSHQTYHKYYIGL